MEIILRACWLLDIYPGLDLKETSRRYKAHKCHLCMSPHGELRTKPGYSISKAKWFKDAAGSLKAGNCLTLLLSSVHAERFAFHFGRSEVALI